MFSQNQNTRSVGRFSVTFVSCIYAADWYVYHFVCHPTMMGAAFFNIAFFMALSSYLRACCTDPGTPESNEWTEWSATHTVADWDGATKKRGWAPGDTSKCEVCFKIRPERAHHCNLCGVCILRMDHHCPWIGNCVGWRNHKFFILLTGWSACACMAWLGTLNGPNVIESLDAFTSSRDSFVPFVFVVLTILMLIITGGMATYSFSMVTKNITAIEQLYQGENPYMYRTSWENVEQLLGPINLWFLFPVFPSTKCRGSSYPVANVKPQVKSAKDKATTAIAEGLERAGYGATAEQCRAGISQPNPSRGAAAENQQCLTQSKSPRGPSATVAQKPRAGVPGGGDSSARGNGTDGKCLTNGA